MNTNYPIITLPTQYLDVCKAKLEIPSPPVEPKRPKGPIKKPKSIPDNGLPLSSKLILLVMGASAISGFFSEFLGPNISLLFSFICGTAVMMILYFLISKIKNRKRNEVIMVYDENELSWYNTALQNYETSYKRYINELSDYNQKVKDSKTPNNIEQYRRGLFEEAFSTAVFPEEKGNIQISKGAAEDFFYSHLRSQFGIKIHQNKMLQQGNVKLFPDFTYFDKEKNIIIDIEIDEPYIGSNGEPIHYLYSNDTWRNSFFNEKGWVVLRFAEEQIIKQPKNCCRLVNEVVQKYITIEPIVDVELVEATGLSKVPSWTKEQAHRLAFRRYRFSYLPMELQAKIQAESFDTHTSVNDEQLKEWKFQLLLTDSDLPY
jgi:very-short-patch-repair endonuclease